MKAFRHLFCGFAVMVLAASPLVAQADDDGAALGSTITLSVATMQAGLIAVTTLHKETRQPGVSAYGRVVDSVPVLHLHAEIAATQARTRLADAALARTQRLYHAAQNVSKARLEQAQANDVEVHAHLDDLTAEARLRYGTALGSAILGDGPAFRRLATGGALVSVIIPSGPHAAGRGTALASGPDGQATQLTRVGRAGMMPTGVIGTPYYFTGPAMPAGTPLAVTLPGGKPETGYDVPVSALVWQRDVPRLFLQIGRREFREVRLPQTTPIRRNGTAVAYFVPKSRLPSSPAIVTKGAGLVQSAAAGPIPGGDD